MRWLGFTLFLGVASLAGGTHAQEREVIQFGLNETGAAIPGEIEGRAYRDYILGANAGQVMSVALFRKAGARPFFNILPPSSTSGEAIYIGSNSGPHALLALPESGDFTLRVYLLGDARDSGGRAEFYLSVAIR